MISIIIPTLEEEANIERCLKSLKNQSFRGKYEILVIDGYSLDDTVRIARKYVKRVYFHPPKGPGHARNCGANHAKGEILAFIDADCEADYDWLKLIFENFKDKELLGLGGVLKPRNPRLRDRIMFNLFSDWWVRVSSWFGVWQLYGNNCAYRKKAFQKIGGFNQKVSFWEDTELSMRVKKVGKLRIDGRLKVVTSTRRFRQMGYITLFKINFKAFFSFMAGKKITTNYFQEIKH